MGILGGLLSDVWNYFKRKKSKANRNSTAKILDHNKNVEQWKDQQPLADADYTEYRWSEAATVPKSLGHCCDGNCGCQTVKIYTEAIISGDIEKAEKIRKGTYVADSNPTHVVNTELHSAAQQGNHQHGQRQISIKRKSGKFQMKPKPLAAEYHERQMAKDSSELQRKNSSRKSKRKSDLVKKSKKDAPQENQDLQRPGGCCHKEGCACRLVKEYTLAMSRGDKVTISKIRGGKDGKNQKKDDFECVGKSIRNVTIPLNDTDENGDETDNRSKVVIGREGSIKQAREKVPSGCCDKTGCGCHIVQEYTRAIMARDNETLAKIRGQGASPPDESGDTLFINRPSQDLTDLPTEHFPSNSDDRFDHTSNLAPLSSSKGCKNKDCSCHVPRQHTRTLSTKDKEALSKILGTRSKILAVITKEEASGQNTNEYVDTMSNDKTVTITKSSSIDGWDAVKDSSKPIILDVNDWDAVKTTGKIDNVDVNHKVTEQTAHETGFLSVKEWDAVKSVDNTDALNGPEWDAEKTSPETGVLSVTEWDAVKSRDNTGAVSGNNWDIVTGAGTMIDLNDWEPVKKENPIKQTVNTDMNRVGNVGIIKKAVVQNEMEHRNNKITNNQIQSVNTEIQSQEIVLGPEDLQNNHEQISPPHIKSQSELEHSFHHEIPSYYEENENTINQMAHSRKSQKKKKTPTKMRRKSVTSPKEGHKHHRVIKRYNSLIEDNSDSN